MKFFHLFVIFVFFGLIEKSASLRNDGLDYFDGPSNEEKTIGMHQRSQRDTNDGDDVNVDDDDDDDKWFEQPLDHFNHRDNRTWLMRYLADSRYFNGTGPILLLLGGEWTINVKKLRSGIVNEIGKERGGLMFYTEHRYYGKSRPTENLSTDNMRHLNVDQALADVANFLNAMRDDYRMKNGFDARVVVFGASYAGNMAAWTRLKYPHLVQGAVASSAPVYAKADFYDYNEAISNAIKRYDDKCAVNVKIAFDEIKSLISNDSMTKIVSLFNLCETPKSTYRKDINALMLALTDDIAEMVQYNKGGLKPNGTIGNFCKNMTNETIGSPILRLATRFQRDSCNDNVTYSTYVRRLKNETYDDHSFMRQWLFQTCTEYGYFQTINSNATVFGNSQLTLDVFIDLCTDVYGEYYGRKILEAGIRRTNVVYGGERPQVRNVVFTNGDVDPYHTLSVLEDINESSPAIVIPDASHCQDLSEADPEKDPPGIAEVRERIKRIVFGWL